MASVRLAARAFAHLERIFEFYADTDPTRATRIVDRIQEAIMILEHHPHIGRPADEGRRELIIAHGRDTFVALYRWKPVADMILILAIRNAREAGYAE